MNAEIYLNYIDQNSVHRIIYYDYEIAIHHHFMLASHENIVMRLG